MRADVKTAWKCMRGIAEEDGMIIDVMELGDTLCAICNLGNNG